MDFNHKKFCIFLCKTYILSIIVCVLSLFVAPILYFISVYIVCSLLGFSILSVCILIITLILLSYIFYYGFNFFLEMLYLFLGKYEIHKETILDKYEGKTIENKKQNHCYIRTKNFSNVLIFTEWQYRFFCKENTDIYVICPKRREYQIFGVPNCYID